MPDAIGVIQGRMGSTRLPGKLLAPIAGRPLLEVMVRRLAPATVGEWWLATTSDVSDDVSVAWAETLGLRVYRGDPDDVLSRFAAIAAERRPDWVVRITADDPFVNAALVDALLSTAQSTAVDLVTEDAARRTLPLGYAAEAVTSDALLEAAAEVRPPHHRAHVTSFIREHGRVAAFTPPPDWPARPGWRWTVDTHDDLAMADAAFREFADGWSAIAYAAMVSVLDQHPDITSRNAGVRQKAVVEG